MNKLHLPHSTYTKVLSNISNLQEFEEKLGVSITMDFQGLDSRFTRQFQKLFIFVIKDVKVVAPRVTV